MPPQLPTEPLPPEEREPDPTPAAPEAPSAPEPEAPVHNPLTTYGVETNAGVSYVTDASQDLYRQRRIVTEGGKNLEHVSEDADGIWIYRQM